MVDNETQITAKRKCPSVGVGKENSEIDREGTSE